MLNWLILSETLKSDVGESFTWHLHCVLI